MLRRTLRQATLGLWLATSALACAADSPSDLASSDEPLFVASALLWPQNASTGVFEIPVCWAFDGHDREKQLVQGAVERSWQRYAAISFTGWGRCFDSTFDGISIGNKDDRSNSRLGTQSRGAVPSMWLNLDYLTYGDYTDKNGVLHRSDCKIAGAPKDQCIQWVGVHEFGHALGFAHEQDRGDHPPSAEVCVHNLQLSGDVSAPPPGATTVDLWDPDSIMNYCGPNYQNTGELSATDIQGVQKFYQRKPSGGIVTDRGRCANYGRGIIISWPSPVGKLFGGDCDPSRMEHWTFPREGHGAVMQEQLGSCLDGAADPAGTLVHVRTCASSPGNPSVPEQSWEINKVAIRDLGGRCLEINAGNLMTAPVYTWAQVSKCSGTAQQQWTLQPGTIKNELTDGVVAQPMCLDEDPVTLGVRQGYCTPNAISPLLLNQYFTTTNEGEIRGGDGTCLTSTSSTTVQGGGVMMAACTGAANQKWFFTGKVQGSSGQCLSLPAPQPGVLGAYGTLGSCDASATTSTWDMYP